MEDISNNPYLKPEDYHAQYKDQIEAIKNDPKLVEFSKLCYELFHKNEMGQRFVQICMQRYIIPALAQRGSPTYETDVIWGEGFKEFMRMVLVGMSAHDQFIKQAGTQ